MVAKRRGKRKNESTNFVFEVSDSDVSSDNSDNDSNEPQRKILKTNSKFVESVVNALSNLENQAKIETEVSLSKSDKEEIIQIDESFDEVNGSSSANEDEVNTQNVNANKEEVDVNTNETTKKCLQDESVIVIGEDTICEIKSDSECSKQCVHDSPIVIEDDYSTKLCEDTSVNIDVEEGELAADIENIDEVESGIHITFDSKSISEAYKAKFVNFINSCTDLSIVKQDVFNITVLKDLHKKSNNTVKTSNIVDSQIESVPNDISEQSPKRKKKRKKIKKEKELFTLDTNPSETICQITQYSSKFQISENSNEKVQISSQVCFNCEKNHALKDCPFPRNHTKINQMRQQFKMAKEKQTSRYHLEEDQKYDHLKPGKISNKLREALGLKSNQIPSYIYHMRMLGYPPGWLEEAKMFYSNLALFDTDGKHVRTENVKKNQGLDPNKIIEYPGFNVPLEKNTKDEYKLYRVPSYSDKYSKEEMIKYFEKEYAKLQDDFENLDMDLDITNDCEDSEELSNVPTCLPKDMEKVVDSPSLIELETQKQTLLEALDDNSSSKLEKSIGSESTLKDVSETLMEESDQTNELSTPSKSTNTSILNSNFGTPILKSCSPFSTLPNPDNFMKDVSPVINFENLPNTTGKYEKMSSLLQKVRNTLKTIQKDDS